LWAYGPQKKKEARDTLALPAKGFALCTHMYEWMTVVDSCFSLANNTTIYVG
jgi:hypothetical protein